MQGFGVFTVLKGVESILSQIRLIAFFKKIMRFSDLFIPLTTVGNVIP
jgi:hypothetical protein